MQENVSKRILAFRVDDDRSDLSFLRRLAVENGWSHAFAERAFTEYLRFLVLCHESERLTTPSCVVDEVWHLHLCYTRSYWQDLCRDVIGKDIHHGPTVGGPEENAKYRRAYADTLQRYAQRFGSAPDPRFWPPPERRFRPLSTTVRVDTTRYHVIPRRLAGIALVLMLLTTLPGCERSQVFGIMFIVGVLLICWFFRDRSGKGNGHGGCGGTFGGCGSGGGDAGSCGGGGCGGGCGGS